MNKNQQNMSSPEMLQDFMNKKNHQIMTNPEV
jgi:hypothetical protein